MRVPTPLPGYLAELYGDAHTVLRIGAERNNPIRLNQGVRQAGPLSVHLYNAVMNWCLADLVPQLGTLVGEVRVNVGAFADDIALIARPPMGLQSLLKDLAAKLQLCGLEVSAGLDGKSASLRIDVDGKWKRETLN